MDLGKDDPNIKDMIFETGKKLGENDSKKVVGGTRVDTGGGRS